MELVWDDEIRDVVAPRCFGVWGMDEKMAAPCQWSFYW